MALLAASGGVAGPTPPATAAPIQKIAMRPERRLRTMTGLPAAALGHEFLRLPDLLGEHDDRPTAGSSISVSGSRRRGTALLPE
jgi:hypothetical protein